MSTQVTVSQSESSTQYQPTPEAQAVLKRYDALQSRNAHPAGTFDSAGRWYPDQEYACCSGIRSPSRAYPYSRMVHCRTLQHVLHEMGVADNVEVVREVKSVLAYRRGKLAEARRAKLAVPVAGYKSVALTDAGEMRSIYDGQTVYALGVTLREQARSNHGGGYYVYVSPHEAADAAFPDGSQLLDAPHVIIECECSGRRVSYNNGKIAYSTVTPRAVVASVLRQPIAA